MPQNHRCSSCGLCASVGWFHYHRFTSGFGSETWCVCRSCGTMSTIRHPVPRSFLESTSEYAVNVISVGKKKLDLLNLIRKHMKCSVFGAKAILESVPFTLLRVTGDKERTYWKVLLDSLGITSEFKVVHTYHPNIPKCTELLLAQPEPHFSATAASGIKFLCLKEWIECTIAGPVDDELGTIKIELQGCNNCKTIGCLTPMLNERGEVCPHCGRSDFNMTGGWVT